MHNSKPHILVKNSEKELHITIYESYAKDKGAKSTTDDTLLPANDHVLTIQVSDTQKDILEKIKTAKGKVQRAYDVLSLTDEQYTANQAKKIIEKFSALEKSAQDRIETFIGQLPKIKKEEPKTVIERINNFKHDLSNENYKASIKQCIDNVKNVYDEKQQESNSVSDEELVKIVNGAFDLYLRSHNDETKKLVKQAVILDIRDNKSVDEIVENKEIKESIVRSQLENFIETLPIQDTAKEVVENKILRDKDMEMPTSNTKDIEASPQENKAITKDELSIPVDLTEVITNNMKDIDERIAEFVTTLIPDSNLIIKKIQEFSRDFSTTWRTEQEQKYLYQHTISSNIVQGGLSAIHVVDKGMKTQATRQQRGSQHLKEQQDIPGVAEALSYKSALEKLDTIVERFQVADYTKQFRKLINDQDITIKSLPEEKDLVTLKDQKQNNTKLTEILKDLECITQDTELYSDASKLGSILDTITKLLPPRKTSETRKTNAIQSILEKLEAVKSTLKGAVGNSNTPIVNKKYISTLENCMQKLDTVKTTVNGKVSKQSQDINDSSNTLTSMVNSEKSASGLKKAFEWLLKLFDKIVQPNTESQKHDKINKVIDDTTNKLQVQKDSINITQEYSQVLTNTINSLNKIKDTLAELKKQNRRITRISDRCLKTVQTIAESVSLASSEIQTEPHSINSENRIISVAQDIMKNTDMASSNSADERLDEHHPDNTPLTQPHRTQNDTIVH